MAVVVMISLLFCLVEIRKLVMMCFLLDIYAFFLTIKVSILVIIVNNYCVISNSAWPSREITHIIKYIILLINQPGLTAVHKPGAFIFTPFTVTRK